MKVIERDIFAYQENDFFSPMRSKIDYARIIALGARSIILDISDDQTPASSKLKLVIDKMSRLFLFKDQKYFSIAFPFTVDMDGPDGIEISSYSGKKIDNEAISAIISVLNSEEFNINPSLIDFYIEPNGLEQQGIFLLEEIFMFEPSYIRYDLDTDRVNGKLHPENHLDINYSQYSTFKLGLNAAITHEYFEHIQNIKTDCCFLID